MKTLSYEQLQKLNTKRLLALKRSMNYDNYYKDSFNGNDQFNSEEERSLFKQTFENIKEILATREHIKR